MRDQIMTATETRQFFERTNKDARMRALAQACVAYAMNEHGPVDPEHAEREAHDIASLAAHLLVSRIYVEDTELRQLKEENEHLRQMAFKTMASTAPKLVVPRAEGIAQRLGIPTIDMST